MRWEYKTLSFDTALGFFKAAGTIDLDKTERALNDLGKDGWELVSTFESSVSGGRTGSLTLFLKRPIAARP